MTADITPLFSAPVYTTKIDVSSRPNWNSIEWTYRRTRDPSGDNWISSSDKILDTSAWQPIRKQIDQNVDQYFRDILGADRSVQCVITESWLNKYEFGHSHKRHMHPNSVISSALFFDEHPSELEFYSPRPSEIDFERSEFTLWNSKVWTIKPVTGLLVLFPSWLEHSARIVDNNEPRYSLSFDTKLTGQIEKDPFRI